MKQIVCPYCQSKIDADDKFCPKCGQKIISTAKTENTLPSYVLNEQSPSSADAPNFPNASKTDNNAPLAGATHEKSQYPKAKPFKRITAMLIDLFISLFLYIPALMLLWTDGLIDTIDNSSEETLLNNVLNLFLKNSESTFIGLAILTVAILWSMFYGFCKDGFGRGQSFGKKTRGLMVVVLEDNKPCTKVRSILRLLVYYVPYINGILTWVELILIFTDKKGLRLGDRLAGTQVIEKINYNDDICTKG